ncbi:hypothetical protein J5N97_016593 [Dioscorea zingiberensis]|uniref:PHD-type domain-containing protein n=1 Tax=Dioscorea zingiberensis TaxID=325984 RepID=A0A9D5HFS8_9LILI|nr:hypothetical protein J5N97_016593 [Dioscorea zingiberensis]
MASEPSPKKRPRPPGEVGDLKRVAEIVMVLSAMGEMRTGGVSSAVVKSLVAEALEKLAKACEIVNPRDLFSREAVTVLVEDLGLNRSRDPMSGFRPPKTSIAEKLLLTKRKMEESKEVVSHSSSITTPFQPVGFHASSEGNTTLFNGAPRFLPDKPSPLLFPAGGVQTAPPMVPVHTLGSASSSSKLLQMSTVHPVAGSAKSSTNSFERTTPLATTCRTEVAHFRLDQRSNGSPYLTHVRDEFSCVATTDSLPEKSSTSSTYSATIPAVRLGQTNKFQDATTVKQETIHEANPIQTSVHVIGDQDLKGPAVQAISGSLFMGHQNSVLTYMHPPTGFPSHNDIAQNVQRVLQNKASEHSNRTPPSTDYVNKALPCQICKIAISDVESLLICDSCEKGTHLKCLQSYSNKGMSKLEWHCPKCLISSNGKRLQPKYGRVTRTPAVPKVPSSTSVAQASTEKKSETSDSKINHQIPNGNPSFLVHASTTGSNLGDSVSDLKTDETKEIHDMDFSIRTKMEDGMCSGTTSDHSKEVTGVECVKLGPDRGSLDEKNETTRLSPSEMQKSNSESMLQMKGEDSSNLQDEIIKSSDIECPSNINDIANQSVAVCDSQVGKNLDVPISFEASADLHDASKSNMDESEELSKSCESSKGNADSENMKDDIDTARETPSRALDNGDVAGICDIPSVLGPHTIGWVGDILKVVEDKTYYQACHIKGMFHKLQDHVMVSSDSRKNFPSKIQTLWEDNKTGLRSAVVIPYYFPAEIPETVSCPTPEDREVYASNEENTIMVGEIHGTCEVLPIHKFKEEYNKSNNLQDKENYSHPIFFCEWIYDESKGVFQSIND